MGNTPLSPALTSDVQGLALLAFTDVVVNFALDGRVVQFARGVVNDHLRGVVSDHFFLVDVPPAERARAI